MLGTWSQRMSQNSYHYQQNDWWEEIELFCLPNHVFQLAHFIGEIAYGDITIGRTSELNPHIVTWMEVL